MKSEIVEFLRKRDYLFIEQIGQGGCGKTYLLYDDIIEERFVCKKYQPHYTNDKDTLFENFIREIKLLHLVYHANIVRVFNYYLYPEQKTGYILMEYINGLDIEQYLTKNPEEINKIFIQTIEGFRYLEMNNILHRDIRTKNILVDKDGVVKIIDFGFGKRVVKEAFDKSISLNWWCAPPQEFNKQIYDFRTEIYFVGKLFEKIIIEGGIQEFKYNYILQNMCQTSHVERISKFSEIIKSIQTEMFGEIEFEYEELQRYREFSNCLFSSVKKIDNDTKYFDSVDLVKNKLEELYKQCNLEEYIPTTSKLVDCFLNGEYYFNSKYKFPVYVLKEFLYLLRTCTKEKRNIILSNLQSKMDSIIHYKKTIYDSNEDLPF